MLISHILSIIRGIFVTLFFAVTRYNNSSFGNKLRIYGGAALRIRKNASAHIGNHVKIDRNSVVSALNGGELVLGNNVAVGSGNMIVCHRKIVLGDNTILAPNVMIYDHDHLFDSENGVNRSEYSADEIIIGRNCWIAAGAIILKGTHIGNNCTVGAGCVLKGDYPDGSLIIQKRETTVIKSADRRS